MVSDSKSSSVDENALDKLETLRRMLDATTDGILALDSDGIFTYANVAAARILGVCKKEIVGRAHDQKVWRLTTTTGAVISHEEMIFRRAMLADKGVYGHKLAVERPDGNRVILSVNAAPLKDSAGQVVGVVEVFTDITNEHELMQRQQTYLHTVAHDLRIPLTVIQGYAEILKESLATAAIDPSTLTGLNEILSSTKKMDKMIGDLVNTARLEGQALLLEKERIDLQEFAATLLHDSEKALDVHRLDLEIPPTLPFAWADPRQLERIFQNLLSNALKYSSPESRVIVKVRQRGEEIVVSVRDHGKGIAFTDLPHIFKPFYPIGEKHRKERVGLGLYVSKMLVEAHGGRLWVESQQGEGSEFYFSLQTA